MIDILIYILIISGSFFILLSALGLLKFEDLYSRLHAGTKASSFGIFLIVLGVCFQFNEPVVYIKGLFIIFFIYLTAPLSAHAIIKSFKDINDKNKSPGKD